MKTNDFVGVVISLVTYKNSMLNYFNYFLDLMLANDRPKFLSPALFNSLKSNSFPLKIFKNSGKRCG